MPISLVSVYSVVSPLIIAHRGASAEKPENTLAAFRRALAVKADGMELDVHVTRDGMPVVCHDDDLFRLTGVQGRISTRTWRELGKLRGPGPASIPRLADVLRLTGGRAVVQIELKAGARVAPVVRVVRAARAEADVILASFSLSLVRAARRLAPAVPRMLITEGRRTPALLVRQLAVVGASGLSVNHHTVRDAAWVRYFQARGHAVWCWTVNDPARMRQLAAWGVDGILSDNPALLCRVLAQKS